MGTSAPDIEFYVDAHADPVAANGSIFYPFTTIQAALDIIASPADQADAERRFAVHIAQANYDEDLVFPASRKIVIDADYQVVIGVAGSSARDVTFVIDGDLEWPGYRAEYVFTLGHSSKIRVTGTLVLDLQNSPTRGPALTLDSLAMDALADWTDVTAPAITINAVYANLRLNAPSVTINSARGCGFTECTFKYVFYLSDCGIVTSLTATTLLPYTTIFSCRMNVFGTTTIDFPVGGFICDSRTYKELVSRPIAITNPGSVIVLGEIAPTKHFYVDANFTGHFWDGSEEYPFTDLATAVAAVTSDGVVINIRSDIAVPGAVVLPAHQLVINGNGYTVSRAEGSATFVGSTGANAEFIDVRFAGSIWVQASTMLFTHCTISSFLYFSAAGTGTATLIATKVKNTLAVSPAITILNAAAVLRVFNGSQIKGYTGFAAIEYAIDNSSLHVSQSRLVHGDGGTNSPLAYSHSPGTMNVEISQSEINAAIDVAFTNLIGAPNNVIYSGFDVI